ncbi:MAG TPA: hypothetical protein PK152_19425 [Anaerolineales bacterium]|nr:hypothetical protein [Anaerolineae bacterium]HRJ55655.1 hypothetical protein [Anaerolineales bacterium]HRK91304.1 hypothetical protein [Anaerolineales bacterium]
MSTQTCEQVMEEKKVSPRTSSNVEPSTRSIFTRQTGQALISLGMLFKHVPPFNETIERSTGETLISIGRKLSK